MTEEQLALLSQSVILAYPVRPWSDAKIDARFLGESYFESFGKWHRGTDINGTGGGDTDLGWPVQSMFPGHVEEVAWSSGYGHVVRVRADDWVREFVEHVLDREISTLEAAYAHLLAPSVKTGDFVNAGDHLGSIGKGGEDQYPAHLHLEVRSHEAPAIVAQEGTDQNRDRVRATCLDVETLFKSLTFSDRSNIRPQHRMVCPARLVDVDGRERIHDTVVVTNVVDGKFYLRDRALTGFWQRFVNWLRDQLESYHK